MKHYPLFGFTERLNDAFIKSGLTQKEFGKKIGVGRKTVINYIYGVSQPQTSTLGKICKALNVSADYLLFGKED